MLKNLSTYEVPLLPPPLEHLVGLVDEAAKGKQIAPPAPYRTPTPRRPPEECPFLSPSKASTPNSKVRSLAPQNV